MTASNPYLETFKGRFAGIMRWPQLDALWATLRRDAADDWYIYAVGEAPPAAPVSAERRRVAACCGSSFC